MPGSLSQLHRSNGKLESETKGSAELAEGEEG